MGHVIGIRRSLGMAELTVFTIVKLDCEAKQRDDCDRGSTLYPY